MNTLYDITFPETFRAAFIPFMEDEVEKVRAEHEADSEHNHSPNEYVRWAEPLLERLRATEGDYVALDGLDVETLRRDLLPAFLKKRNEDLFYLLEIHYHDHVLKQLLQEQLGATKLLQRLYMFADYDVFDETFKGDRPEDPAAPAASP